MQMYLKPPVLHKRGINSALFVSKDKLVEWIIQNKEWLFGGIAIAVPLAIIGWFFSNGGNKQNQKGGDNSTNIQVGGNVRICKSKNDK